MQQKAHDPLDWLADELADLDARGLRRELATHEGPQQVNLRLDGNELINFGSNDYLGLAADPRLATAAAEAIEREGTGAGASPLVTGHSPAQQRLELALAEFKQAERALVFSSGFAANMGVIPALVGRGDAIFADARNHASMIDGCRLSRAEVHIYPHGDWRALERLLKSRRGAQRALVATESIFSMDGDAAPLVEIAELCQRHDCMLLVDEAHATGVFGEHGRGLAEALRVEHQVHIRVGTLSKALGASGGFVAGSAALVDWLVNRARSYVFSTAIPPSSCAAALAALAIVREEPQRRRRLLESADRLRQTLARQGWEAPGDSQIVPLRVGDPRRAVALGEQLRLQGLLTPAMRPPSVAEGESLVRLSLTSAHTAAMFARLEKVLEELKLGVSTG